MEMRAGFPEEAMAVYQRGIVAVMASNKEAPKKDKSPSLLDPGTARGIYFLRSNIFVLTLGCVHACY